MRYLILLLFPLCSYAQDSTVCIKPSTARYYLETEDRMYVLQEKDSINGLLITNLGEQVLTKDRIIRTYEMDSELYLEYIDNLLLENSLYIDSNEKLERKLRLRKALEVLGIIGLIIASIL